MAEYVEKDCEYAMLSVAVTTACGVAAVKDARVTVYYNGLPGSEKKEFKSNTTDENGKTESFSIHCRRAKVGNRYVNYPRYSKCDVEISAEGFIPLKARDVPIFPGITVIRAFDLIPKMEKSECK